MSPAEREDTVTASIADADLDIVLPDGFVPATFGRSRVFRAGLTGPDLRSVALGDGVGNVVLAGSGSGIYRSTNGGTSFTQIVAMSSAAVFADPQAPSHVVASGFDQF